MQKASKWKNTTLLLSFFHKRRVHWETRVPPERDSDTHWIVHMPSGAALGAFGDAMVVGCESLESWIWLAAQVCLFSRQLYFGRECPHHIITDACTIIFLSLSRADDLVPEPHYSVVDFKEVRCTPRAAKKRYHHLGRNSTRGKEETRGAARIRLSTK